MSFDIIIIGCIGIDTNVYFYGDGPDFDREGNFTQNIDYIGQAGGYAARLAQSLGLSTALIASIGDDFSGNYIRQTLIQDGINCDGLFIDPLGTNRSINFMYADGRRKNFYDGKGNFELKINPQDYLSILQGAKVAHLNIANWCRQLIPQLQQRNIFISTDLQDITDFNDEYRKDFLEAADIVFFSLTNFQGQEEKIMLQFIKTYPDKIFVAGNGAKGCFIGVKGSIKSIPPSLSTAPIIDTNGAGDALAMGTINALVFKKMELHEAVIQGQELARKVCTLKASSHLDP